MLIFRKRKGYHNPVLPQASNASTTHMNGNVRKQAYIKKKDSNSLSTPTLKTSRISSVANGQEKPDTDKAADKTEDGVYNHLHEQATKQNAKSKNDNYSDVSFENKEYSKCGYIEKNSVIIGDNEYGTSNTLPKKPPGEVDGVTSMYEFTKNSDMSPDVIRTENENERGIISDTRKRSTEKDIMGDEQDSKAQVAEKSQSSSQSTENRKTKKEKCYNEKTDSEDVGSLNKSSENKKTKKRKVSNEKTVPDSVYSNLDRNSNEYGNWKEISEHLKPKDSNSQGEDKLYSNTETIYSNNPTEEIYSNTSSNL